MTGFNSISQTDLSQRRRYLRRQRRWRNVRASWRTVAISALAGSMTWMITLPGWVLRQPSQVAIEGNHLLSTQAIQKSLPLNYPQSLLDLQPQAIAAGLEAKIPITEAKVTRQLFPPRLTVVVKERRPIAIAATKSATLTKNNPSAAGQTLGLVDETGAWTPLNQYSALSSQAFKLPQLRVLGMREEYRPYWPDLYQTVMRSPVKVLEIDWQDAANLILKTELGEVHLGPYSHQLPKQLQALDRMRNLSKTQKMSQVAYIDLKNPDSPSLQLAKSNRSEKAKTSTSN